MHIFRRLAARVSRPRTALWLGLALLWPLTPAAGHVPHDPIHTLAVSPSFDVDQTIFAIGLQSSHRLFSRSLDGGRSWEQFALAMTHHSVDTLRFSPAFRFDRTAFAASDGAGVFRTLDGGTTWEPVNAGLKTLVVHDLAVSPGFAQDHTLAIATDGGCYLSTDGGNRWHAANSGLVERDLRRVAFSPTGTLFAGRRVLHRSADGGATWQPLSVFDGDVRSVAFSPAFATDGMLAVAVGNAGGVHVSTDGGLSFTPSVDGLIDLIVNEVAFADDGTLFAATRKEGCFRNATPFGTWVLLKAGLRPPAAQSNNHYVAVCPSPTFSRDGVVFLGTFEGLYRSDNRGNLWRMRDVYHQRINRAIALSPDFANDKSILLANFGGGAQVWEDGVWSSRANGIKESGLFAGVMSLSPSFATDDTMYVGYTGLWRSADRGATWKSISLGFLGLTNPKLVRGIALSPEFDVDRTVFIGTVASGIWRSQNAGTDWQRVDTGVPQSQRTRGFAISPAFATDGTLFLATRNVGVYRTTNGAQSWQPANTGLTELITRSIKLSPDFPSDRTLFVGTAGDGLFKSTDAGDSWFRINRGLPNHDGIDVEGIAVSPNFAVDRTVFVSTQVSGVHKSTDGGATWRFSGIDLPRDMPRSLAISPDFELDRTLILSTNDWVWRSTDAGENWEPLPGYLRVSELHPLVFYSGTWAQKQSHAGSHGRAVMMSNETDASTTYEFFGDSIAWYASMTSRSGIARVLLDGVVEAEIDLYATETATQQEVWSRTFDEPGWHAIEIVVTGKADPASADTEVHSDGFAFTF